jgi:hypothetical protein
MIFSHFIPCDCIFGMLHINNKKLVLMQNQLITVSFML